MAASDVSTRYAPSGFYRALLIPDERCGFDFYSASLSTASQAGRRPGDPMEGRPTRLRLETSGTIEDGASLEVVTARGGGPGPQAGAYLWGNSGDTFLRGNDEPTVVSGAEVIVWTSTETYTDPDIIPLTDGALLVAACKISTDDIATFRRDVDAVDWDSEVTTMDPGSITWTASPTLVQLPDGRVLCFFWVEVGTDLGQVRMYYSDDGGGTWTEGQRACLQASLDTSSSTGWQLGRLRARYGGGQILLMGEGLKRTAWGVGNFDDQLFQWASDDLGCSFSLIERSDEDETVGEPANSQNGKFVDVVYFAGMFVVAHIAASAAFTADRVVRRIASAFEPLSGAKATIIDGTDYGDAGAGSGSFDEGGLALWCDDVGSIFMLTQQYAAGPGARLGYLVIDRSLDGGATWAPMGQSGADPLYSKVFAPGDINLVPWDWAVCAHRGRAIMVHGICPDAASTYEGSLAVAELGGFSTHTMPAYGDNPVDTSRASWELTYTMAWTAPNVTAWAVTTAGAPAAASTADGWWNITTAGGESRFYGISGAACTSSLTQGLFAEAEIRTNTGTGVLGMRLDTGATRYETEVRVGTASIVLYDVVAGAAVATVITGVATTGIRVQLAQYNNDVYAVYRPVEGHDSDREWRLLGSSVGLSAGATTGAGNRIRFGVNASNNVDFRDVRATYDEWAGSTRTASGLVDADRWPRSFSSTPAYLDAGVLIAATSGPAFPGDDWTITPEYEHGVEHAHLDVTPSPRRPWRSEAATAPADPPEMTVVWEWNSTLATVEPFRCSSVFLALLGVNFRSAYLEGRTAAGAWEIIGECDTATGMDTLHYTRQGRIIYPDTGTAHAAGQYMTPHLLAGSHVYLDGTDVRPISKNTRGAWRSTTTLRPFLTLDDYDDTEPTSGTLEIWSKDALLIVHDASPYNAIRVRIPTQPTHTRDFRGKLVVGDVWVMGRQYSLGRIKGREHGTELFEQRSGTRSSRVAKPSRRYVQLPWTELVSSTPIWATSPEPNYVTAAVGGEPVAAPSDTLHALAGLMEELDGPGKVIGYLESMPRAASASTNLILADRSAFLFGRVTSADFQLNHDWGDEGQSEINTSPGMLIQEEL